MTFYMALTPPGHGQAPAQQQAQTLEKTVILKDGFSFPAFLLTGLWLLYKRLWWAFALFVLCWLCVAYGLPKLGLPKEAIGFVQLIVGLFLGHEGHAMVERKLVRDGWRLAGVVEARDMDAAERRFFELALAGQPAPLAVAQAAPAQHFVAGTAGGTPIIGLFPEPRGRSAS